jgi:hypothetical protein
MCMRFFKSLLISAFVVSLKVYRDLTHPVYSYRVLK